jgi:hypothetical protein
VQNRRDNIRICSGKIYYKMIRTKPKHVTPYVRHSLHLGQILSYYI